MSEFERRTREDRPVVAICYDFDKTLTPDNMQAQGYLQSINYEDQDEFWAETNQLAREHEMDTNLAWMYLMLKGSFGKKFFRREMLAGYGAKVELYFEKIYGSSFFYDKHGLAMWPAQVINYTNKTQFLFRVSKGVLDINDDAVNDYFPPDQIRVPTKNMVYIGDSFTDIPCMKVVNSFGGHSIGVYDPDTGNTEHVRKLLKENRIRYYAPADYTEGSQLDELIKMILDKTIAVAKLDKAYFTQLDEAQ